MAKATWSILVTVFVLTTLAKAEDSHTRNFLEEREERSIDPNFLRRYNHLKYEFRDNPLAFNFMKYFLRNRGQKRERRQVDNRFVNNPSFDNGYITYIDPNKASTSRPKDTKREATKRRPFRPPMVFF